MADDNKIEDLIQVSKDRFLPKEVTDQDQKKLEYSLDKEFAKTKKSFDWKFYSILLIFLLVVIGGTFLTTTYVEIQNQKTQYSFNIEDINLQEQITSTKREEKNVNLAREKLNKVIKEKESKIAEIENAYTLDIEKITKSGSENSKTELEKLKTEKENNLNKINSTYAPLIAKEESNVEKAESDFADKKAKLEADINKADKIVNNYKRLQQMQITALKTKHADEMTQMKLKYNPNFTEANIREILRAVNKIKLLDKPVLRNMEGLTKNHVISESELKAIRSKIEDYQNIINRMQKIPYTNSVDPALKVMQNDTYFLISEYERIMAKMLKNLEVLNKYQQAFNQIAEFSVDSGIIIDGSNPNEVIFSLKPVVQVKDGDTGLIFRKSDEPIGTILFELKYGKITGVITEVISGQKIQPLDKIFIRKKITKQEKTESMTDNEKSSTPADESINTAVPPKDDSNTIKEDAP